MEKNKKNTKIDSSKKTVKKAVKKTVKKVAKKAKKIQSFYDKNTHTP